MRLLRISLLFPYTTLFRSVSFFAVMIIPDGVREHYLENLIGGLAMSLHGPFIARLIFHAFVVVVGTFILAGAVNTDRKSTRLNSSHRCISYAVFCLKTKP